MFSQAIILKLRNISRGDELIKVADMLVDGPFVEELKDTTLRFRGSSNQRIIELKNVG